MTGWLAEPRFVFVDEWKLPGATAESVAEVLTDLAQYPTWWPEMRAVARISDDAARLLVRSRLPHTIDLLVTAVSRDLPTLEVALAGDLNGTVRWTITDGKGGAEVAIHQDVVVTGWAGTAARFMRPVMRWNHEQSMVTGRRGLAERLK